MHPESTLIRELSSTYSTVLPPANRCSACLLYPLLSYLLLCSPICTPASLAMTGSNFGPASMCNELPLRKVTPNESCDALKSLSIINAPLASMQLVIFHGGFF